MSSQYFDIKPVAGRIGAKIIGLDLSTHLSDDIISDIRKTLVYCTIASRKARSLRLELWPHHFPGQ
jgi:hypothetical protein